MDTKTLPTNLTIEKVLQQSPRAFIVFLKNQTKCVGCFMQQFCTLKDVAETYQIPLEKLIEEIEHVSDES